MAMFHCSIKIISRASGRSAVASAAYRSGKKLYNEETGITHDFTKKGGVVYSEICIPDNAPKEFQHRGFFWNEVQKKEKRADAQLAREIEVAIPKEFSREQQIRCVQKYISKNFVEKGMCADWALHDKGNGNPHAHIMLTVRAFDEKGKWIAKQKTSFAYDEKGEKIPVTDEATGKQKVRIREGKGTEKLWVRISIPSNDWNDHIKAKEWREAWAIECNKYLTAENQIDHRSYEKQGIEKTATIHEGFVARDIERNGGVAERCELNREIRKYNCTLEKIKEMALDITRIVVGKARVIINGFNELRRSRADIGNTRADVDNFGRTADRSRTVGTDERSIESITRGNGRIRENIEQRKSDSKVTNEKISKAESVIANTSRIIEELTRIIKAKEREKNERIKKLLERRSNTQCRRTPNGERRASGEDTATLIREIRTATNTARATIDASRDARENSDLEQQRLAVERNRAKIEAKQGDPDRSRKIKKMYDRGR